MSNADASLGTRVALLTAPDADTARRVARTLVEERLAACVNVVPGVTSIYRWEGALHEDAELLLVAKTTRDLLPALAERLAVIHPYALPELVALTPSGGSERYLAWVREECGAAERHAQPSASERTTKRDPR